MFSKQRHFAIIRVCYLAVGDRASYFYRAATCIVRTALLASSYKMRFCYRTSILLAALISVAFADPSYGQATATDPDIRNERYRIGFQDVVEIQVFRHPDLTQRVSVGANGYIHLFRLDRPIMAVCKTERELANIVAAAYRESYLVNPQVNATVVDQKSQSVSVIGAVEKPGTFFINRRVHLLEMLAMAGGPNKESGTRLIIARAGSAYNCRPQDDSLDDDNIAVIDIRMRDVQEGKKTLWMQPGDVVSVLDADIIYVYGNVNKQGSIKVRETITLTQALVSAEGLKSAAKKDKIRVLRQQANTQERIELVFDLDQIDKGKIKDPILEPNDIVAVSEDRARAILQGIANSIKSTVPNAIYRIP